MGIAWWRLNSSVLSVELLENSNGANLFLPVQVYFQRDRVHCPLLCKLRNFCFLDKFSWHGPVWRPRFAAICNSASGIEITLKTLSDRSFDSRRNPTCAGLERSCIHSPYPPLEQVLRRAHNALRHKGTTMRQVQSAQPSVRQKLRANFLRVPTSWPNNGKRLTHVGRCSNSFREITNLVLSATRVFC